MGVLKFFDGTTSYPRKLTVPEVEDNLLDGSWTPGGSTAVSTTTTLTLSASTVNEGTAITLTATVSPAAAGSVIFERQSGTSWVAISTDTASPWTATFTPTTATTFRARFLGSATHLASTSASKTVTVKKLTTYTKTYACTGSASYQSDGDKRSGIAELYQGYYSSTNGNQRSVAAFNDAQIRADLAGATITKVELYLNALHWGDSGGGTAVIGTSSVSGVPASGPSVSLADRVRVAWSSKNGAKWCLLTTAIGNDFKDGTAKSILLGPGPSTSTLAYYGYFAGNGQSGEPQLRITYQKYV